MCTALCRKFRSTDCDLAIDELQGIQTGHMQQHDGALRPHHNQVGKHLDGLSDYDGGQRLRSAIKIYVLGPIRQAKNNHMASGNGDAYLDPTVADSQAWGDMNDEQRGLLLDTAGSSMLDDCLKGTWLIHACRWLAENDMLTNMYSATSVGSHGIGDDWDFDKDKRGGTPSSSSSSDDNDPAGPRKAKKKKRRTGHQKPQQLRSLTSQDRLTDSADKIVALIETTTPAEPRGAVGHQKPQQLRSPTSQDRLTDSADKIIALIETTTPAENARFTKISARKLSQNNQNNGHDCCRRTGETYKNNRRTTVAFSHLRNSRSADAAGIPTTPVHQT